jgi:ubiquinone/menaquinone biosynthesis C-methylase UbiE
MINKKIGNEINLLKNYPITPRDLNSRSAHKTEEDKKIAREFGKDFFDGERRHGYGGFNYSPKYWTQVVSDIIEYYKLKDGSKILDIGCGKGFMLYDFLRANSKLEVHGIDISSYAIKNCLPEVKNYVTVGNARQLNFADNSYDLVISINTLHNLKLDECKEAFKEASRVSKSHSFIIVDAYRNIEEKKRMESWNLTALTYMSTKEWELLFAEVGYTGDYYWFIP